MYQRRANTYRAEPMDGPERIDTIKLARLFEDCERELEGDPAFYMGQLADYFRNHYKPNTELKAHKVLGL